MVEFVTVEGRDADLQWVADLYGQADENYRDPAHLEHVLRNGPQGPALHSFVVDRDRPVGHSTIIPMPGRLGQEPLRTGKLEAIFIEAEYRGVKEAGQSLARTMLDRLYAFADDRGFELLHAFTPIPRTIRFTELHGVGPRSLVSVLRPIAGRGARVSAIAQRVVQAPFASAASVRVRAATADDRDLVEAPLPPAGSWTLAAADAWDWYRASPHVRIVETGGRNPGRVLVQVPGKRDDPLRIAGWRLRRPTLRAAVRLLRALIDLGRELDAPTVRFQPWGSPTGDGMLKTACLLLGFVPRNDFATLWVRTGRPKLARAEAVVPTPLLWLGL
jgi:hypothetical protein